MEELVTILVPIFLCVVLPVAIVAIIYWEKINSTNKRTQVLIKAIEANNDINADKLAEALSGQRKSAKEILNGRLLRGCMFSLIGVVCIFVEYVCGGVSIAPRESLGITGGICLAVGISFLVVYFVTRRQALCSEEKE